MDYELELLIRSRYDRDESSRTVIGLGTIPREVPTKLREWVGHHVNIEIRYPQSLNGGEWVLGFMAISDNNEGSEIPSRREELDLKLSTDSLEAINANIIGTRMPVRYSVR